MSGSEQEHDPGGEQTAEGMPDLEVDESLGHEGEQNADVDLEDHVDATTFVDLDTTLVSSSSSSKIVKAVVKMKLNTLCANQQICGKLRVLVTDMNRLLGEAYAFMNFHTARLMKNNTPPVSVDRNFCYRCLVAASDSAVFPGTLGDEFKESILQFDALRPDAPDASDTSKTIKVSGSNPLGKQKVNIRGVVQVVADLSKVMETMVSNHLWTNLSPRIERYLGWRHPTLKRFHKAITRAVVEHPKKPIVDVIAAATVYFKPKKGASSKAAAAQETPSGKKARKLSAKQLATQLAKAAKEAKKAKEQGHFEAAVAISTQLRELLPLPSNQTFTSRAHMTLPLYHNILQETEVAAHAHKARIAALPEGHRDKKCKFTGRIFSLLPLKSGLTTSHIPISSMTFVDILKKCELSKHVGDGRTLDHHSLWAKHLNLKLVETKRRSFGDRIITDGYAVSAIINCPVSLNTSQGAGSLEIEEIRALMKTHEGRLQMQAGLDPGFTDVFTAALMDSNGKRSVKSYSSARYYEDAKINNSRRKTTKWNAETKQLTDALRCTAGCKTTDLAAMKLHLRLYLQHLPGLLQHRQVKGYRRMRFMRFVFKKRTVKNIVDMIVGDQADETIFTVVGFGDWSGGSQSPVSRRCAGPIQEIKEKISRRRNAALKMMDEHKTSQNHHETFKKLVNMKAKSTVFNRDGTKKTVFNKVHKVLHCQPSADKSKTCKETTVDRDVNAAKNILMLLQRELEGLERPSAFCRQTKNSERQATADSTSKDAHVEALLLSLEPSQKTTPIGNGVEGHEPNG
jgi:hypothetical protein